MQRALDRNLRDVVEGLELEQSAHVLDLGGGTGKLLRDLGNEGIIDPERSLLVDSSRTMLMQAQSRTPVRRIRANPRELPLRSSLYEGAFVGDTLDHTEDPVAVLAEVNRVLRPGGWTVIEEIDGSTLIGRLLQWGKALAGTATLLPLYETPREDASVAGLVQKSVIDCGYVNVLVFRRPE